MEEIRIKISCAEGVTLPEYATEGASGMDLRANEATVIPPGARACVPTGVYFEMPLGVEAQVRPRSGLALKHGITVLNSPGTIDSDYRGEIKVILINLSNEDYKIEKGDRIAQIIFTTVAKASLIKVDELNTTARASGGFGSTGKN